MKIILSKIRKKYEWFSFILAISFVVFPLANYAYQVGTNGNPPVRTIALTTFPRADVDNWINSFGWVDAGFSAADSLTTFTYNSFFPLNGTAAFQGSVCYLNLDAQCDNGMDIKSTGTVKGNGYSMSFENRNNAYIVPSVAGINPFIFNNVALVFGAPLTLGQSMIFQGNCVLDCQGNVLDLSNYSIVVDSNSNLLLQNATLVGLGATQYNVRCADNTSTLSLSAIQAILSDNYTFSLGSMDIIGDVMLSGTYNFSYLSTQTTIIRSTAQLSFDVGMTFSYNPTNNAAYLINMENRFSTLYLNQASLYTGSGGLQLTNGTLVVDGLCPVVSSGGLWLGGGTSATNLFINVMPESGLFVTSGYLVNNNV